MPAGNPEPEKSKLRILYAVGPGDVVGQYRDLLEGKRPEFQIGMSFSMQFVDWCDQAGAVAHLVSWHDRPDVLQVGPHRVENRAKPALYFGSGVKHHIGAMLYGLKIVKLALLERPDVLIVDSGTTHWIVLSLLALFHIPVIAVIHNTLWPMGFPPQRRLDRLLRSVDGFYFRHFAAATVAVSPECERQVRQVAGVPHGPIYQCRAQYRHGFLDRVSPPHPHSDRPFRTLFLGRIEENKGVFLIVAVAERLEKELPGQFAWRIVGSGSASEELVRQVEERKLAHIVKVEGRIPDEQVALKTFGWAHAMIVPTTSEFCEALPMVAAESILAGRPVVVSTVVPAWEVLGGAAIKAETGSVESFAEAFRKLAQDPNYYDACRNATPAVQAQFYDAVNGLGNVLGHAIADVLPQRSTGAAIDGHATARADAQAHPGKSPLRILYAVGPGDAVGLFRDRRDGKLPAFQISLSYTEQFLDWCNESGAVAHLISSNSQRGVIRVGPHTVENRPNHPLYFADGLKHHIGTALYGLSIVKTALREKADIVIADSGTTHWIVFSLLALFHIPVIGVIYSGLWPMGFPPQRGRDRLLRKLDGFYFRHFAAATVCISPECARQVEQVAGRPKGPRYQFIPQYYPNFLSRVKPAPPHSDRPFRILFLGRVEEFKGVFMILDMAERLEQEMPGEFAWKIIGYGSAEEELRRQAEARKLGSIVDIPGRFQDEATALATFGWSHAMIVPTTSRFFEGLAMVAAESILAGRPVILSDVVPAWEVLGGAVIKCKTDSVGSFVENIRRLATDAEYYTQLQQATADLQAQYYDASNGLGNVIGRAIAKLKD